MKLVIAIVQADDAGDLLRSLTRSGYRATRINTAGGFLREGNATMLIGVEAEKVDDVLGIIGQCCHTRTGIMITPPALVEPGEFPPQLPVEVTVGGATIFVVDVERFERL